MSLCPNCDQEGSHFFPPCMGEPGFYTCNHQSLPVVLDNVTIREINFTKEATPMGSIENVGPEIVEPELVAQINNDNVVNFYKHKGYFLTALWQHRGHLGRLSKETEVDYRILAAAANDFQIDLEAQRNLFQDGADVPLQLFLDTAGVTNDVLVELQPMPGVDLEEMNLEKHREMCAQTTRCICCNSGTKQTSKNFDGTFTGREFICGTTLDANGNVAESKQCARNQARGRNN